MIITKITGGLGNQLFQYAVGKAVALHHNVPLKLDITAYETYKLHNGYRLDQFSIAAEIASKREIKQLKGKNNLLIKVLRKTGLMKKKTYFSEKQSSIYDVDVYAQNEIYLDGYWQNERYFAMIRNSLLKEVSPNIPLSNQAQAILLRMQNLNAVSIHVRRGDYLNINGIGILDVDYYLKAVNHVCENVESPVFLVFSNDLAWCKKNFEFIENSIYVEETQSEIDDLMLMSHCKHNIIANSSFSWWGAWLNKNYNKIVIAPKGWRLDDPTSINIILPEWIKF